MVDYPLESIHKHAFKAAEASHCAGDQGKFWEMRDLLFAKHKELAPEQLRAHAETVGLDLSEFDQCLESGKHAEAVRKDLGAGAKAGVRGTPYFAIGYTDLKDPDKVQVVRTLRGAQPFTSFKGVIDGLLSKEPPKKK